MFQKQHTNNIENTSISISDFILSLLMVLIFMNLLVGLTVSGIAELKKTGTIMQAKKRVDDILLLSKILPEFIWPKNLMSTELKGNSKKVHTKASCCLSLFEYKVKYVYKQYPK